MEKENNTVKNVLLVVFMIATLILGGYILYDKILKKDSVPIENKQEQKENMPTDLVNILPLISFKESNYKANELTNEDIYDAVCTYVSYGKDYGKWTMEKSKVDEVFKKFLGKENYNLDLSKRNSSYYTLSLKNKNGVEYYELSAPANDAFIKIYAGEVYDVRYDNLKDELQIILDVQRSDGGTPYTTALGKATVKLDLSEGISLISYDFEKYDSSFTIMREAL